MTILVASVLAFSTNPLLLRAKVLNADRTKMQLSIEVSIENTSKSEVELDADMLKSPFYPGHNEIKLLDSTGKDISGLYAGSQRMWRYRPLKLAPGESIKEVRAVGYMGNQFPKFVEASVSFHEKIALPKSVWQGDLSTNPKRVVVKL